MFEKCKNHAAVRLPTYLTSLLFVLLTGCLQADETLSQQASEEATELTQQALTCTAGKYNSQWEEIYGDIISSNSVATLGANVQAVTGEFESSLAFPARTLTSYGSRDVFLAKFDDEVNTWAIGFGGQNIDVGTDVAFDAQGNLYASGYFVEEVEGVDAHENHFSFQAVGDGFEGFLIKFSPAGEFRWARVIGGPGDDLAHGVSVFSEEEAIYATGEFEDEVTVDEQEFAGSKGGSDVFVVGVRSDATLLWADGYGGPGRDVGYDIANTQDLLYITGTYAYDADFGGGGLSVYGQQDIFLAAFELSGYPHWSRGFGSQNHDDIGFGVAANGDIVSITGRFEGTLDLGGNQFSATNEDAFVGTYSHAGNHVWSESVGIAKPENEAGWDLTFGPCDDLYVTGTVNDEALWTLKFDGFNGQPLADHVRSGSVLFPTANALVGNGIAVDTDGAVSWTGDFGGYSAAFLEVIDDGCLCGQAQACNNGQYDWLWQADHNTGRWMRAAYDDDANLAVTGSFYQSVTIGGSTHTSNGSSSDFYLAKYDSTGALAWSTSFGSSSHDTSGDVRTDGDGNLYIAATVEDSIDLGGGLLTKPNGGAFTPTDYVLAKFSPSGVHLWSKILTGLHEEVMNIDVTEAGEVFGAGYASSTMNVDGNGVLGGFLFKLDTHGNLLWSHSFEGEWDTSFARPDFLAVRPSGGVVINVSLLPNETYDFGTSSLTSSFSTSATRWNYLSAYDASGNQTWHLHYGDSPYNASSGDPHTYASRIAIDDSGNVFVAGHFAHQGDFGWTTLTPASTRAFDGFVMKVDPQGTDVWAKRFGDYQRDWFWGLATLPSGDILVGGSYEGTPYYGTDQLSPDGEQMVMRLDGSQGGVEWTKWFEEKPGQTEVRSLAVADRCTATITIEGAEDIDFGGGPRPDKGQAVTFAP